jgi:hypothetical protein
VLCSRPNRAATCWGRSGERGQRVEGATAGETKRAQGRNGRVSNLTAGTQAPANDWVDAARQRDGREGRGGKRCVPARSATFARCACAPRAARPVSAWPPPCRALVRAPERGRAR